MNSALLRPVLLQSRRSAISVSVMFQRQYATQKNHSDNEDNQNERGKWFTLPPYTPTTSGSTLGKALLSASAIPETDAEMTALKWVLRCCPELPRSLVQKLFRLRQVRRESCNVGDQAQEHRLKRVAVKDLMNKGDTIFLPISVQEFPSEKQECQYMEEEVNFIRDIVLYKDPAIVVLNKPPGLPVQGGIGIKRSLDELAASCLSYDYSEPPRLVHRLDRDSSGILVMGRTQISTTVLHSIFREKTFAASKDDFNNKRIVLQRRYWALVIGTPKRSSGLISVPLGKVVVDSGKSDRITVMKDAQSISSQHAVTHYKVIESSSDGFTWLELSPLTGRKHQLRVHCAEVLGTPIVGDYKYGWQAHRKWECLRRSAVESNLIDKLADRKMLPFGRDLESGSFYEKHPRLHLHCKQMVLPDVSQALQIFQTSSDFDFSQLASIKLDAPLPSHMQRSWDVLSS
ncbi:hypothetical protein K2173_002297 [Erythroxylum novogranatense]|uniref:Pseudouridine synthase RsuA/RluA-like domain-containing protein n=1 Tax=Erythroxylum novogranatense TaxID=1862640 RepID=A0AAV8TAN9_9ROSI|nr:hypothetical protein K2173_002297 [Erythroxylum novogranatense]